jgi:hypothetical protein
MSKPWQFWPVDMTVNGYNGTRLQVTDYGTVIVRCVVVVKLFCFHSLFLLISGGINPPAYFLIPVFYFTYSLLIVRYSLSTGLKIGSAKRESYPATRPPIK